MSQIQHERMFSAEWWKAVGYIILGSFIFSMAIVMLVAPFKIAPGGTYGIGIVVHHLLGWNISTVVACLDWPLLIIGTLILGPIFGFKTALATAAGLFFTWLFETQLWTTGKPLIDDPLLASIFAGVLYGIAMGIIFKSKATSGGSDIISMILHKYTHMSLGKLVLIVDSTITLITIPAFGDWKLPCYAWILIYIQSKIIDMIVTQEGFNKTVMIISDEYEKIRQVILKDLDRGGTLINVKGLYQEQDRKMIYVVLNRREVEILKQEIRKIDPRAFVNVTGAGEILGNGFKPHA
jgi:uncharacterized membrane-anchored protein YitT (DUF2179 family)